MMTRTKLLRKKRKKMINYLVSAVVIRKTDNPQPKHNTEENIWREQMDKEAEEIIQVQNQRCMQAGGYRFAGMTEEDIARDITEMHQMQRCLVDRIIHDRDDTS
eukprot:3603514-Ditylum_brightwellii.AAC.1